MGKMENTQHLGGERPLGRPRKGWKENITMDFTETGFEYGWWMERA
jgi:hypothetical protein